LYDDVIAAMPVGGTVYGHVLAAVLSSD